MTKPVKLNAEGYRPRDARIALRCEAMLIEEDGCALEVVITDVSRDGFRLESRGELEVGADVILLVPKMAPIKGTIRWTCGFEAGGVFLEPVAL